MPGIYVYYVQENHDKMIKRLLRKRNRKNKGREVHIPYLIEGETAIVKECKKK